MFDDRLWITKTKLQDVDDNGVKDVFLTTSAGTILTLPGISDASTVNLNVDHAVET